MKPPASIFFFRDWDGTIFALGAVAAAAAKEALQQVEVGLASDGKPAGWIPSKTV